MNWFRGNDWRPQNTSNIEIDFLKLCNRGYHILHELDEMPFTPPYSHILVGGVEIRPDFLFARKRLAIFFDGPVHTHQIIWKRDREVDWMLGGSGYEVKRFAYESYSPKSLRTIYEEIKKEVNDNGKVKE